MRVAVVGTGFISDQYLANLLDFPDLSVVALADIDVDRARAQAKRYAIPAAGGVAEVLARDDVELIVNLTIPAAHAEVSLAALESGKHVWSEKPLALDRESGAALLDAARDSGVRIAGAPDTILGAGLQGVRRIIADGEIGAPLSALALFQSRGPESWHPNPDFFFAAGGGPLFDIGPYYLTTLVHNLGPVASVSGVAATARSERMIGSGPRAGERFPVTVPTHVSALLEFVGGASAQVILSFDSHRVRSGAIEFVGSTGTVVTPDPNQFDGDIEVWPAGSATPEVPDIVRVPAVTYSRGIGALDLARAVRGGFGEQASGELAFHVLDVMVSIIESAERSAAVAVVSTVELAPPLPEGWDPRARAL